MSDPNKNPRRSKLEDEVLEILAKADRKPPLTAKAQSWGRTARARTLRARSRAVWLDSAWGWFGLGLLVFVIGGWITGDSGMGRRIIELAGVSAVLIGVYRMARPSGGSRRKIWRGRQIDMRRPGVELGDRFDEWRKRR